MKVYSLRSEVDEIDWSLLEEDRESIFEDYEETDMFYHEDHVFRMRVKSEKLNIWIYTKRIELDANNEEELPTEEEIIDAFKKIKRVLRDAHSEKEPSFSDPKFNYVEEVDVQLRKLFKDEVVEELEALVPEDLELQFSRTFFTFVKENEMVKGVDIGYPSPEKAKKNKALLRSEKPEIDDLKRIFDGF